MITAAHRLVSIVDYDKILFVSEGKVVEEGDPFELIKKGGYFSKMIKGNDIDEMNSLIGSFRMNNRFKSGKKV